MQASPSTHFVSLSRSRSCIAAPALDVVWPQFLLRSPLIGGLFFGLAILRFRSAVAQAT